MDPMNAHRITHTRPIVANGRHFNAANDSTTFASIEAEANEEAREIMRSESEAIRADLEYARLKADGSLERDREAEAGRRERQYRDAQEWANGRRS